METTQHTKVKKHNYFSALILERPDETIARAKKILKKRDFDTFVVIGLSGASAGALLGHALNKNVFVLRKEDDLSTHDGRRYFGQMGERWVFLDDLIDSGSTRKTVMERIKDISDEGEFWDWVDGNGEITITPEYVGDYMYASYGIDGHQGRWEGE